MKKNFALILTTCLLLTMLMTAFVACNNTVTLRIYRLELYDAKNGNISTPSLIYQISNGHPFTVSEYKDIIVKDDKIYGAPLYLGFYSDKQCTKKVHPDTKFSKDTDLYTLVVFSGADLFLIKFVFEGQEYMFYQSFQVPITIDDFVVSAYGKELDRTKLHFFSDEAMTNEIEIIGKTYDELVLEETTLFYQNEKTVYIKLS